MGDGLLMGTMSKGGGDGVSKETPCPVCGWWNETNDACIYHPESVEVTA